MTIELNPEQQSMIDLAVQSGAFENPNEVLAQAFDILREQLQHEDWLVANRDSVAAKIANGFAQAERGELVDGDSAIEILHRRRAEKLKKRE